jgi:hypothetical protein
LTAYDARRCGPVGEPSMEADQHVRVALVGCSGLLGSIIGDALAAQPDLEVVADLETPPTDESLPDVDADLVLWNNADETRVARWLGTLSGRRGPRVLATLADGRDASLWELRPHRTELGALSPETLVETIRRPATGG